MSLILPTSEPQTYTQNVLKENIITRKEDLEAIREWLRKQPHLPDTLDERRLFNYLKGCKFSLEKCKKKLDMYFTMKAVIPEYFKNRDVSRPELKNLLNYAFLINLPTLTPDSRRVYLFGVTTTDFETPDVDDYFKLNFMTRDISLEKEEFDTVGDVFVLDGSVAILKHILKVSPMAIKKFVICNLEAYPTTVKEIHIINLAPYADQIINMFRMFIKEKIKNRIHIHSNLESLHKYVPKYILPEEYGGTAGKLDDFRAQSIKTLQEYTPWFKEQEMLVADESKRPGKSYCYEDIFGLDGSFRQLTID